LIDLGLAVAFSEEADFTGINSGGGLSISNVVQKTFIKVNEEGSEAEAVTSVGIGTTSVGPPTQMICNRPFVFVISDRKTNSICFVGKVGNPAN
jgi:serpin B